MRYTILYSILILFVIGAFSISEITAQEIEELEYQISGAEVTYIELDSNEKSLTITIDIDEDDIEDEYEVTFDVLDEDDDSEYDDSYDMEVDWIDDDDDLDWSDLEIEWEYD